MGSFHQGCLFGFFQEILGFLFRYQIPLLTKVVEKNVEFHLGLLKAPVSRLQVALLREKNHLSRGFVNLGDVYYVPPLFKHPQHSLIHRFFARTNFLLCLTSFFFHLFLSFCPFCLIFLFFSQRFLIFCFLLFVLNLLLF